MPRLLSLPRPRAALATAFVLACLARPAAAQLGPGAGQAGPIAPKSPVAHQVFQRDANGLADIPIELPDDLKGAEIVGSSIGNAAPCRFDDGKFTGVPTGGPYTINLMLRKKDRGIQNVQVGPVFVGDLWVLAGQSNMEGVGRLVDVTPTNPRVMALGMDGKWVQAVEPLHWLDDSPDPIHSGDPATRAKRAAETHASRKKGAGLGLPFASAMVNATNVRVGLVVAAHGGTSMAQWSPSKKGEGGNSLYGSMLRQLKLAGGKVKGVLWYQGESDTGDPKATAAYPEAFAALIAAVRSDLGRSDLPFYFVQIGRVVGADDPKLWNLVQDAQRRLADEVANTAVIAVIDLELDDAIHIGTQGLKRAGERLARIAQRELFGLPGATTPTLDRVNVGADNTLVVKFQGVNRSPIANFQMGSMMGGQPQYAMAGGQLQYAPAAAMGLVTPNGLRPERHIAGFSIRGADGREIPLIYEAAVGPSGDTVILKLIGKPPGGSMLWYGWGRDPYCNLTDALDMAVPVTGPIPIDGVK